MVYGAFCEYGNGDYEAEDKFPSGQVKASGVNEYIGLGLLGKIKFVGDKGDVVKEGSAEGLYVDGSMRVGSSRVDYKTLDIQVTNAMDKQEV
ncbi:MAG: hypothetical protein LBD17_02780, partial [Endomicrobium sp.]|nr:hypothetical protein [Endomicrobium sp.]